MSKSNTEFKEDSSFQADPSSSPSNRKVSKNMQEFGDRAAETLAILLYKVKDSEGREDNSLYELAYKVKDWLEQLDESLEEGSFGGIFKRFEFGHNAGEILQKVLKGMNGEDEQTVKDVREFSDKAREALDKLLASFEEVLEECENCECEEANEEDDDQSDDEDSSQRMDDQPDDSEQEDTSKEPRLDPEAFPKKSLF